MIENNAESANVTKAVVKMATQVGVCGRRIESTIGRMNMCTRYIPNDARDTGSTMRV